MPAPPATLASVFGRCTEDRGVNAKLLVAVVTAGRSVPVASIHVVAGIADGLVVLVVGVPTKAVGPAGSRRHPASGGAEMALRTEGRNRMAVGADERAVLVELRAFLVEPRLPERVARARPAGVAGAILAGGVGETGRVTAGSPGHGSRPPLGVIVAQGAGRFHFEGVAMRIRPRTLPVGGVRLRRGMATGAGRVGAALEEDGPRLAVAFLAIEQILLRFGSVGRRREELGRRRMGHARPALVAGPGLPVFVCEGGCEAARRTGKRA